jgi:UDP-N-acetylmuramate dehydrogenase
MSILEHHDLSKLNTFGLTASARYFAEVTSIEELRTLLLDARFLQTEKLILGGGSNMLLTKDFDGLVIKISIKGISLISTTAEHVLVKAMAGEVWHDFVLHSLEQGWYGLENMSLIPGQVGAAPMQNIGAYGVELEQVFESLEAMKMSDGTMHSFRKEECHFGYRESIFKRSHKGQFVIVSATFRLSLVPNLHIAYGAIKDTLHAMHIEKPGPREVSQAVISIRQSKLPDPKVLGNAGSFFKNPEISLDQFQEFIAANPNAPHYKVGEHHMKIPAGWLIEQCGWKGKVVGNTGSHKDQALVLVNYGQATGNEIVQLSRDIQASVKSRFNIELEAEVNII